MGKFKIEFKWAIYLTFLSIIWFQFEKLMGWHSEKIASLNSNSYFIYPFVFLMYYLAIKDKKTNYYNLKMSWQQGLISGGIVAIIAMVLAPFAVYFGIKYISPNYFENLVNYYVLMGKKPEEMQTFFNLKSQMMMAFFSTISFGIIFAALASYLNTYKKLK